MPHDDMFYTRFHEGLPLRNKAMASVEVLRLTLGMQGHGRIAALPRFPHKRRKNQRADSSTALPSKDRHAADVPVRQKPAGAQRLAVVVTCDRMERHFIHLVPFELDRHTLLVNEHSVANWLRGIPGHAPVRYRYVNHFKVPAKLENIDVRINVTKSNFEV